MANDKKFVVKNGLRADNVQFTDSATGLNQINVNMLNTDTLQFEGDAGTLLSISDDLTGTVFSVGDISGIPIIEAIGETHNITMAEFDGKVMIGTTDSGGSDSDKLNVEGTINTNNIVVGGVGNQATGRVKIDMPNTTMGASAANIEARAGLYLEDPSNNRLGFDINEITCSGALYLNGNSIILQKQGAGEVLAKFNQDGSNELYHNNVKKAETSVHGFDVTGTITSTDSAIFGGNGSTGGVKVDDGAITIRTGTGNVAYVDFYCEVSNAHRTRLKSAAHASYSGDVDITLPTTTGTLPVIDANGDISISADLDKTLTIGRWKIGYDGTNADVATLGHVDLTGTTNYALKAFNGGITRLNGTSKIEQAINGTVIGQFISSGLYLGTSKTLLFEGSTADNNETTLTVVDPTKANTVSLPDSSGTVALLSDIANSTSGGSITIQEEGTPLTTGATTLNFVGSTVTATGTGATKTITISAAGALTIQDEGSSLSSAGETLNFVGAGVVASGSGTTKTITINGGSTNAVDAIVRSLIFG